MESLRRRMYSLWKPAAFWPSERCAEKWTRFSGTRRDQQENQIKLMVRRISTLI